MPPVDRAICNQTEALYHEHYSWLHSWLWKKLGCPQKAADFSHDTFIRVLARPRVEAVKQPRAFLATIATRLLIDNSRRERIERTWRETHKQFVVEYEIAPSAEEIAEMLDALERIIRMLDGLSDRQRNAFLMYRLDGMPQATIAKELGVTVSMVKKYVAQGLLHCHRVLHTE